MERKEGRGCAGEGLKPQACWRMGARGRPQIWDSSQEEQAGKEEPDCEGLAFQTKGSTLETTGSQNRNFVFLVNSIFSDNKGNSICRNFGKCTQGH